MPFLFIACLLAISIMIGGCTSMQNQMVTTTGKYPDKPIMIIVPFTAGGGVDLAARALTNSATKYLGQPLVVVNKPCGTGVVGWNELASSNPDGYTIGMAEVELLLHPLYDSTKYNYPTALEPLCQISSIPLLLVIKADQPWQNVNELVNYARQHPGELKFSHTGIGSLNHILGESLAHSTGIKLKQVPFQGGSELLTALLGDHVQIAILSPALVKEHLKNGTVRVLAIASDRRLTDPVFSNVPTFKEQGLDIVFSNSWGIAVPKELPIEVKTKLTNGLELIITDPEFKKDMENLGVNVEYLGPKESQELWITESKKLTKALQETGIVDLIKSQKQ